MDRLRIQYARLLGMDRKLLPLWKACVESFDRNEDQNDNFGKMYTGMIDSVYENRLVDLGHYL